MLDAWKGIKVEPPENRSLKLIYWLQGPAFFALVIQGLIWNLEILFPPLLTAKVEKTVETNNCISDNQEIYNYRNVRFKLQD